MYKKWCSILIFHLAGIVVFAQLPGDTSLNKKDLSLIDTSLNYDDINFDELEHFLDSILMP